MVLFETGQWKITEDGRRSIEQDLSVMRGAPGWVATVEGHADERGTDEWNQALGMYRAKAVKDTLRDLGLEPSQLTIVSYGKTRPISKGRDPESLAVNRRVEIVLHPVPASGRR
ncbi:MAG: OmpA family protein [Acidobacteria bacterium]|nr:OmpA family protein [Acidobacteriota bacterium]